MNRIVKKFGKTLQRVIDRVTGSGLMQDETRADGDEHQSEEEREFEARAEKLLRRAAAEGCVLVRNDGVLPLEKDRPVAVFGRCQLDWFFVGYGSGGDVHPRRCVNLVNGLDSIGAKTDPIVRRAYEDWAYSDEHRAEKGWWGHWPFSHPEMPLDGALVSETASRTDTAIVVIGRAAGEDRDLTLTKGSYYLSDGEKAMLDAVTGAFPRTVVVMNTSNVIDMSWTEEYGGRIGAILYAWLGGMESGGAAADVLYGVTCPSGRLPCVVSRNYADHASGGFFGHKSVTHYAEGVFIGTRWFDTHSPEKALWPLGWGLSYTDFSVSPLSLVRAGGRITCRVTVKNTGKASGRETVLLWCSQPAGRLEKPARILCAFAKTRELAPGESEETELSCDEKTLCSYDEISSSFLLEKGRYDFTLGGFISGERPAPGVPAGSVTLDYDTVVERCERICSPDIDLRLRILDRLPKLHKKPEAESKKPADIGDIPALVAELPDRELIPLTRGHGMMNSPLGPRGNAGVFGGVTEELRKRGVIPIVCCDGPAGLRMSRHALLLPCGTALAATFDTALVCEVHRLIAHEMDSFGVHMLLSPGMNLHRNPLCGRNFEYYSEDPVLSGMIAASAVRGIQSTGLSACPKHFVCNNQEFRRNKNDSRVTERALRELYLYNFELCVKYGRPLAIMTSYNKINGVWAHYNYDIATTVLRGEWGFDGVVITDWWMRRAKSPEFPLLKNNAYRIRAQVDVLMPGSISRVFQKVRRERSIIRVLGRPGGITRAELERSAANVLRFVKRIEDGSGRSE